MRMRVRGRSHLAMTALQHKFNDEYKKCSLMLAHMTPPARSYE